MAVQDWWKLQKVVDLGPEGSKTLKKLDVTMHAGNSSTPWVEAGGLRI